MSLTAVLLLAAATSVFAAGGDFANTDFSAAAPFTYDHSTGGGAYNDRTVGDFNDITEQLEGAQFTCGDVVTYLTQVQLEATTVDPVQSAEFDFSFLADSTGQSGAAHAEILGVSINYGLVENGDNGSGTNPGAGSFGLDSGIADDRQTIAGGDTGVGGSTATLLNQFLTGPLFQAGSEVRGTVLIDDLEPGESLVLRIDTLLVCDPGSSPTGNLQGQLNAGRVVVGTTGTINTGEQTIPFLRVGDISGAGEPLLLMSKSVAPESGVCGTDDVESLTVFAGETVRYCYTLTNPGTADLFDVDLVDDAGTPGDTSDDFSVTCAGLQDLDGDADAGDLGSGVTLTCEALVTFEFEDNVTNIATATGNNGLSGGNFRELTAGDDANVVIEGIPNQPPDAIDDSASTDEDTPVTVNATANDTDPDDNLDPSTANTDCNGCSLPTNGTLTNNGDGTFTYTPDPGFSGTDTFVYEVCDSEGLCDTAAVTITVNPVNDPPTAVNDSASTPEGTAVDVDAAGNDSDPDGNLDPGSANTDCATCSLPTNGTLTNNGDGTFTYTPNDPEFSGTDSFVYEICDTGQDGDGTTDGDDLCDTATVTIDVIAQNDPPVAEDDSYSTAEDTTLTIDAPGILGNDSDADGDALTLNLLSEPTNGTLTQNADGSFTYVPDPDFNGVDTYTYEVCDPDGLCDAATVTITVTSVEDPPVAEDDTYVALEDTPLTVEAPGVLDNDSDPEGEALTVNLLTQPTNGSVTQNADGSFTYTPDPNFNGEDSYTYEACDPGGLCDPATVTITVTGTNDPPVANDDGASTSEDTPVTVNAAANDTDIDGNLDPTSATVTSGPSNGNVTNNGDGTFTYTPDPDFNGTDSFTYEICDTGEDGDGATNADDLCDSATVVITVDPVNDPPVAEDDSTSTPEDTDVTINVTDNDSDIDGNLDPTSVTITSGPSNGTAVVHPDGTITYTPNEDWSGTDTLTYQVCDTDGLCDTATVTITVEPVNDPPVAEDDAYTTAEDTELTVPAPGVLGNDSDVDGDALTANLLTQPTNGSVTQNADGSLTYTPDEDFTGTDSYTYEACDPDGLCDTATVTITVTPVNDPPTAVDDQAVTDEDMAVIIAVQDNDSSGPSNEDPTLNTTAVSDPANGTATINPDGTVTYTPDPNFTGTDTFTYTVCDEGNLCDTATVTVVVNPQNDPPVANDDTATTAEDTAVVIPASSNDTDIDGNLDPTSATVLTQPEHGTVTNNGDGTFTYTPDENFNGGDTFTYEICDDGQPDGMVLCDSATVTVTVTAVNDPPVAEDDAYSTTEDTELTVPAPGVLGNDSDVDGDALTVNLLTSPTNGTLVQNADGSLTYTPNPDFNGVDSYTYEACDPDGLCDPATVTITVSPVNDPPSAGDDAATTNEDSPVTIPVLTNDSAGPADEDQTLTITDVSDPANGTVVVNPDGTVTYTPDPDFNGTDTFTYTVCDSDNLCDTATVTVTVDPQPDPPVALDDTYTTAEDTTLTVDAPGILGNDSDPDGDALTLNLLTSPSNGTLVQNADGSLTYTPNPNFNGVDSYTYEVCDPSGLCDSATVTITVMPVNDPPVALSNGYVTDEDTVLFVPPRGILKNDSDPDGDPLTIILLTEPEHGTVVHNQDGSFTYTPDEDFSGVDIYYYEVCDPDGLCDDAKIKITVNPVNDPPIANDDSASTPEDTAVVIDVDANDLDGDGGTDLDPTSVTIVSGPSNGTVTTDGNGNVIYTPDPNFSGTDTFVYEICDLEGLCDTATVTVTVTPVPDPPVAVDDSVSLDENTSTTIPVTDNDFDVDGDLDPSSANTECAGCSLPSNGTLVNNNDGTFTYTPDPSFHGTDTFVYEVCDGLTPAKAEGDVRCDTATVTITVINVNDPPVAFDNAYTGEQDQTLVVSATDGVLQAPDGNGDVDFDPDGDAIFVDSFDSTSQFGGTVSVNPDGSFSYTPAPGFAGIDTFTYTITDGNGEFDTATVTITVNAKNGRSISVDWGDWTLGSDLSGDFHITNQSGDYDVQITSLAVTVQYRDNGPGKKQWIDVAVEGCVYQPEPLFLLADEAWIAFGGCQLQAPIPADSTVRVTATVGIFGHKDKGQQKQFFLDRLSKTLP